MSEIWYRLSNGQTEGPLTLMDLQRLADEGALKATDSVLQEGGAWRPAGEFPEIRFSTAPLHSLNYPAPAQGEVQVTPRTIELLRQTSLWVRIISVVMFAGIGLMLLASGIMLIVGVISAARSDGMTFLLLGLIYIPLSLIYVMPAIYLHRYASQAKLFARLRTEQALEEAMQAQKSFWKFMTLLTLISVGTYLIFVAIAVMVQMFSHT